MPGRLVARHRIDVTVVDGALVFATDGATLTSDSTLRFREDDEVEADLAEHGFVLEEVRGAPDRPGRELVLLARRPR